MSVPEKWKVALALVREGKTNLEIIDIVKERFGSGISTSKLAEFRALTPEKEVRRREIIRETLQEGESGYEARNRVKAELGISTSYQLIQEIQAELETIPEDAIEEVELPPEVFEEDPDDLEEATRRFTEGLDEIEPPPDMEVLPEPDPEGAHDNFLVIHAWMHRNNVKSLTMTREGDLSVLVEHQFKIGGCP